MSRNDTDVEAGEYVLGTMDAECRRGFEARLRADGALRARVAAWETALTGLEDGAEVPPPADLWPRLASALKEKAPREPFRTVRQDEGVWTAIGPGLEKKHLYRDPVTGLESCLIRMQPGAVFDAHLHAETEECLVLQGDLVIGDVRLEAGDYQVATPGTHHPVLRSESGGTIFVRGVLAGCR